MKLTKIKGPDGSEIFMQYDEEALDELRGVAFTDNIIERTAKFNDTMVSTVKNYSSLIYNSINSGLADIPKPESVQLEFGIQIGGEAGIPFVTSGSVQANVTVTLSWKLDKINGE